MYILFGLVTSWPIFKSEFSLYSQRHWIDSKKIWVILWAEEDGGCSHQSVVSVSLNQSCTAPAQPQTGILYLTRHCHWLQGNIGQMVKQNELFHERNVSLALILEHIIRTRKGVYTWYHFYSLIISENFYYQHCSFFPLFSINVQTSDTDTYYLPSLSQ